MISFKDLKEIARYGYKNNDYILKGYRKYCYRENNKTGFYARVFVKDKDIVISYSGTDTEIGLLEFIKDGACDVRMMFEKLPQYQLNDALRLYCDIVNDSKFYGKGYQITITGHSLGGSLANLVGVITGAKVVGFSTFGVGDIIGESDLGKYKNITNIGATDDFIFMSNINKQLGNIKIFTDDGEIYVPHKLVKSYHSLLNLGDDLSAAEDYERNSIKSLYDKARDKRTNAIKSVKAEIYNKVTKSIETTISNKKNQALDIINKTKNYATSKLNEVGHWVTIDGNHVFIED